MAQLRRCPRCSRAGELGRGGGGGPRQLGLRHGAIRRRGVVPGISGRASLRARWSKGLGCGRLPALARRGVGGRAAAEPSRRVFRRLAELNDRLWSGLRVDQEGRKAWFCCVWHGVWAGSRIMSDNGNLIGHRPTATSGAVLALQFVTNRRKQFTVPAIRADLTSRRPPR